MVKIITLRIGNQEANLIVSALRRDFSETGEQEYMRIAKKIANQLKRIDKKQGIGFPYQ